MRSGPSRIAEAIAGVLIPSACREEILGDLHERYTSSIQYAVDLCSTLPLVIVSRMRRAVDPQALTIQAGALYLSFLGAAWLGDRSVFVHRFGFVQLAIPAVFGVLGLALHDTYARPGRKPGLRLFRGPLLGVAFALVSQAAFAFDGSNLGVPQWILVYGCAMGLLLSSAIRMWLGTGAIR